MLRGVRGFRRIRPTRSRVKTIWWTDGGVHQNMTFPVQPDPVSGMHCWHQCVRVHKAGADDHYGDVVEGQHHRLEQR